MNLIPYPHTNSLNEAMQSNEVKFAFCNKIEDNYQLITNFVKCREYFNEFLMKNYHPKEFDFGEVYGFKYKHKEYPYNLNTPAIAIKFPKIEICNNFINNLNHLHLIEEFNSFNKTSYTMVDGSKKELVLEFDPSWTKSCLLFNIYTLIIKLLSLNFPTVSFKDLLNTFKLNTPSELVYVNTISPASLNTLLNNLNELKAPKDSYVDGFTALREPYNVHADSGLIAFLKYVGNKTNNLFYQHIQKLLTTTPTREFIV